MQNSKAVKYSDFGAVGDGKTDDIDAIAKAHAHANAQGLPVKADDNATYYIGGKNKTVVIQTDTDFGKAKIIIDDRKLENHRSPVFRVTSKLKPVKVEGITSLKRNQRKLDVALPGPCLISVTDSNVKRYIRYGLNQNKGKAQTDVFLVDAEGNVDMKAPIIWDFETITQIKAQPLDKTTLTIRGGHFTTIANAAESKYKYHARNIAISRSNVKVIGLQHHVTGEGDHGAPYSGFLNIGGCANVTVCDVVLTGHKTYRTIGSAGKPVSMGTYDISVNRAINVSFINCSQTNDIMDRKYWGIMGSNFCKNLTYDSCTFSRFDAHMGVCNATIKNSTMGYMGINAIGSGTLLIENSTIQGRSLVNMRSDYGSTWQGEFIFRNCVFAPPGKLGAVSLIGGRNQGHHDFGYTCYMPETIKIEGLTIKDADHSVEYGGPTVLADFNPKLKEKGYVEKYPIVRPKQVILRNVATASGKPIRLSDNEMMFKDVKVQRVDAK